MQWKLPLVVGTLLLVISAAGLWTGYALVRDSVEENASARLPSVVGQLVEALRGQQQNYATQAERLAADSTVLALYALRTGAARDLALQRAHELAKTDNSIFAVQFLDSLGQSFGLDEVSTTRPLMIGRPDLARARTATGLGSVGEFVALGDSIVFPAIGVVGDARAPTGYLVHWRRIQLSPEARSRSAELIGSNALIYLGSRRGAWTDQAEVVDAPPIDVAQAEGTAHYERRGVGRRMAAASRVGSSSWYVLVEFPEATVMAPVHQFLIQAASAEFVVLLLGLVAAWYLSRRLTGPLRDLTMAADAMSAGAQEVRVTTTREDELGRLALAFNLMSQRVGEESAARAASEAQWRLLFDGNPHPMWLFEFESLRFLAVNDATVAQYGWSREEMLEMRLTAIWPPEDVDRLTELVALNEAQETVLTPAQHVRRDGALIDVEITARTVVFGGRPARLVLAHDVTGRTQLEAQLRQAQKMEAIGRLAGGVAHDFNNLLAVITSYSELIQGDLPAGDPLARDLDEVLRAAARGHGLTSQLLAFSRQQVLRVTILDPGQVVAEVERMLRRLIGESIEITIRLNAGPGRIQADRGQLEQVLMNLALNARDAMPAGGRLTISTSAATIDEASAALHGLRGPGDFVIISVSDTGAGMTPEVRARIFDPFFTTKEVGKGTGLGLATVYGIVVQSGGSITVYSDPGRGSTFRVYLPLVSGDSEEVSRPAAEARPLGTETILLVEDEAAVRGVALHVLTRLGYRVLEAESAEAALDLVSRLTGPLHLILTDVVMPRMDGPTLIRRVRETRPELKALLMSGYTGDAISGDLPFDARTAFLEKPFSVSSLAQRVREVLDGRG